VLINEPESEPEPEPDPVQAMIDAVVIPEFREQGQGPVINCSPYTARISKRACITNLHIAVDTAISLLQGESIFQAPDSRVNRMVICGSCQCASPEIWALTKFAFQKSGNILVNRIDNYNEWGPDPEVSRIKKSKRDIKWRGVNADRLAAMRAERWRNAKIEKLEERINGE